MNLKTYDAIADHLKRRALEHWLREWFADAHLDVDDDGDVLLDTGKKRFIVCNVYTLARDLTVHSEENPCGR
jgi:hypothetical protein